MKYEVKSKTLKGRWKPVPPFDKLSWLYDQGFIGSNYNKFRPNKWKNKYEYCAHRKEWFPRFAVTKSQKQYNWLSQIKWEDYDYSVVIEED